MLSMIPPTFVMSLVRHALTAGGAWLISNGIADAGYVETAVGFGVATAGLVWSYLTHTKPPAG